VLVVAGFSPNLIRLMGIDNNEVDGRISFGSRLAWFAPSWLGVCVQYDPRTTSTILKSVLFSNLDGALL